MLQKKIVKIFSISCLEIAFFLTVIPNVMATFVPTQNANQVTNQEKDKTQIQPKPKVYEALLGSLLAPSDYIVSGVSLGTDFNSVKKSLGEPDEEVINGDYHSIRYGGTIYSNFKDRHNLVSDISLSKRDATTGRGIVVGDSLSRVYDRYGFPDESHTDYAFYGRYYSKTSHYQGIFFYIDKNNIINKIWITAG